MAEGHSTYTLGRNFHVIWKPYDYRTSMMEGKNIIIDRLRREGEKACSTSYVNEKSENQYMSRFWS